jgi:mono/diheme cytochrome c family protein
MGLIKKFYLIGFLLGPIVACADIVGPPPNVAAPKAPNPFPKTSETAAKTDTKFASEVVERGKKIYRMNCLQCHHGDPRKAGSQGPASYGASLELLKAKILNRGYPPGYVPQRKTSIMPAMPFLAKEIDALHAYLNSPL